MKMCRAWPLFFTLLTQVGRHPQPHAQPYLVGQYTRLRDADEHTANGANQQLDGRGCYGRGEGDLHRYLAGQHACYRRVGGTG